MHYVSYNLMLTPALFHGGFCFGHRTNMSSVPMTCVGTDDCVMALGFEKMEPGSLMTKVWSLFDNINR